jgi:hypothetical protein
MCFYIILILINTIQFTQPSELLAACSSLQGII